MIDESARLFNEVSLHDMTRKQFLELMGAVFDENYEGSTKRDMILVMKGNNNEAHLSVVHARSGMIKAHMMDVLNNLSTDDQKELLAVLTITHMSDVTGVSPETLIETMQGTDSFSEFTGKLVDAGGTIPDGSSNNKTSADILDFHPRSSTTKH